MIQEIIIKNFLSFKDEVVFSFEATKDKTFEEFQTVEVAPGVRLLRFAVVYGANASGKSNLLKSFEFLREFWGKTPINIEAKTGVIPFRFDAETPSKDSYFKFVFYIDGKKFRYELELNNQRVKSEHLYYYKTVQPTMLFERSYLNNASIIKFNNTEVRVNKVVEQEFNVRCLPNMSFFSVRNQINAFLPVIDDVMTWLKNNFIQVINSEQHIDIVADKNITQDPELKKFILNYIKEADFNIINLNHNITNIEITDKEKILDLFWSLNSHITPKERKDLKVDFNREFIELEFNHLITNQNKQEIYSLPANLESSGTNRIIGIESKIYRSIQKQAFLAIDEIESSLHPHLFYYALKKFLEITDNKSQLLITTHYDPLLNEVDDLFRKDSVWFTEKNESGHTDIYSLVEFKGLKRISSIQKAYRGGKFGASPNIDF